MPSSDGGRGKPFGNIIAFIIVMCIIVAIGCAIMVIAVMYKLGDIAINGRVNPGVDSSRDLLNESANLNHPPVNPYAQRTPLQTNLIIPRQQPAGEDNENEEENGGIAVAGNNPDVFHVDALIIPHKVTAVNKGKGEIITPRATPFTVAITSVAYESDSERSQAPISVRAIQQQSNDSNRQQQAHSSALPISSSHRGEDNRNTNINITAVPTVAVAEVDISHLHPEQTRTMMDFYAEMDDLSV